MSEYILLVKKLMNKKEYAINARMLDHPSKHMKSHPKKQLYLLLVKPHEMNPMMFVYLSLN